MKSSASGVEWWKQWRHSLVPLVLSPSPSSAAPLADYRPPLPSPHPTIALSGSAYLNVGTAVVSIDIDIRVCTSFEDSDWVIGQWWEWSGKLTDMSEAQITGKLSSTRTNVVCFPTTPCRRKRQSLGDAHNRMIASRCSPKSFYRATRMHSVHYAVARFLMSFRLYVYHATVHCRHRSTMNISSKYFATRYVTQQF